MYTTFQGSYSHQIRYCSHIINFSQRNFTQMVMQYYSGKRHFHRKPILCPKMNFT